jgi:hypothetical protein
MAVGFHLFRKNRNAKSSGLPSAPEHKFFHEESIFLFKFFQTMAA